jgi:hypothetical protein
MKKKLAVLGLSLVSSFSWAQVDYSNCAEYINSNLLGNDNLLFETDKDLKITPSSFVNFKLSQKKITKGENKGRLEQTITLKEPKRLVTITREEFVKGKVSKIFSISYAEGMNAIGIKKKDGVNTLDVNKINSMKVTFDYKNNKCYPSNKSVSFEDINPGGVRHPFDTKVCRDFYQYFKENPGAEQCSDYSKALNGLLTKHDQKNKCGLCGGAEPFGISEADSFSRSISILNFCKTNGLVPFLNDEDLWKEDVIDSKVSPTDASKQ